MRLKAQAEVGRRFPDTIAVTAHWVEPRLGGDVAYRERAGSGLRHPTWRGLRFDRAPAEVTLPE